MSTHHRNTRPGTGQELPESEATERAAAGQVHQSDASLPPGATQAETRTAAPEAAPAPRGKNQEEEEWEDSRAHLVKHRRPRSEDETEQFESVYKRETYYIDRSYLPKLKKLIKKLDHTKTAVMNEALEDLFAKYGIE